MFLFLILYFSNYLFYSISDNISSLKTFQYIFYIHQILFCYCIFFIFSIIFFLEIFNYLQFFPSRSFTFLFNLIFSPATFIFSWPFVCQYNPFTPHMYSPFMSCHVMLFHFMSSTSIPLLYCLELYCCLLSHLIYHHYYHNDDVVAAAAVVTAFAAAVRVNVTVAVRVVVTVAVAVVFLLLSLVLFVLSLLLLLLFVLVMNYTILYFHNGI